VVYRSSETSTNQSDVIIRSDNRFLNLVVDSDSIVSKIYMLNFVLSDVQCLLEVGISKVMFAQVGLLVHALSILNFDGL
jgi:hypothetical protein